MDGTFFRRTVTQWCLLFFILVLGAIFRFHHLNVTPPGLFWDEAIEGNQALEAATTGHFRLFYAENNGREPLFVWLAALPLKVFGNRTWALRSMSGIIGVLTVLGVYLLADEVFGPEMAVLSSGLLAASFWHTVFSRIGFRAILAPFFAVWGFYFFMRGHRSRKLWTYAVSGLFWG